MTAETGILRTRFWGEPLSILFCSGPVHVPFGIKYQQKYVSKYWLIDLFYYSDIEYSIHVINLTVQIEDIPSPSRAYLSLLTWILYLAT